MTNRFGIVFIIAWLTLSESENYETMEDGFLPVETPISK